MHTGLQVGFVISTSAINTKFLEPHKNECGAQKLNKLLTLGNTILQMRAFELLFTHQCDSELLALRAGLNSGDISQ